MELYQDNMKNSNNYNIPIVNKKLSTKTILTSSFIPGEFILSYENAD